MISQSGQVSGGQEHREAGAAAFEAAGWDGTRGPGLLVLFLSDAVAKWPHVIV